MARAAVTARSTSIASQLAIEPMIDLSAGFTVSNTSPEADVVNAPLTNAWVGTEIERATAAMSSRDSCMSLNSNPLFRGDSQNERPLS